MSPGRAGEAGIFYSIRALPVLTQCGRPTTRQLRSIFCHVGSGSAALTVLAVIPFATSIRRECAVRETSDVLGNPS